MNRPHIIRLYILKEFLKRFFPALVILFFIFVLQTFWVYFDELAGKGLSLWVIFKFFYYFSPNILLYSLPLAILLAGIMTYGSLGENYELAAIKASGVSLISSMAYLLAFNFLLAIFIIIFVNTAQPIGNLKFTQLRTAIARKTPSVVIREGIFSKVGDFTIKVKDKYGKDDRLLKDVIIHREVYGVPDQIIIAEHGELINDEKSQLLKLKLYNGTYFEDLTRQQRKSEDRKKLPALESKFKEYELQIDLSGMNKLEEQNSKLRVYHMLNSVQLVNAIDSLKTLMQQNRQKYLDEIVRRHSVITHNKKTVPFYAFLKQMHLTPSDVDSYLARAQGKVQATLQYITRKAKEFRRQQVYLNKHIYALHEKWATPLYIFLLFLVGIPLGAAIRKGGYGLPTVIGIIFFSTFYVITMLGKSMAEEGVIPAWTGAWLPIVILIPFAVYLLYFVNKSSEIKWLAALKTFYEKLFNKLRFGKGQKLHDIVIFPAGKAPDVIRQKALSVKKGKEYELFYLPHEKDPAVIMNFLQKTQDFPVYLYWKPGELYKNRHDILGDELMIEIKPGSVRASTNLHINYRFADGKPILDNVHHLSYVPYKTFFSRQ